jgi:hypothetical protein
MLPLIRQAFELGRIDEMVYGPWGDVLDELGVEPEEGDPLLAESRRRFEERQERLMPREQREQLLEALERFRERARSPEPPARVLQSAPHDPRRAAHEKARKHKNKRKIEAASRKANRRKHK